MILINIIKNWKLKTTILAENNLNKALLVIYAHFLNFPNKNQKYKENSYN
jgi:hypothetical protein